MKIKNLIKELSSLRYFLAGLAAIALLIAFAGNSYVKAALPAPGGIDSGLITWQKADDGTATGALWADSSGNSNDATQSSASIQPTFVSNGINFNPAFSFDGSNDFLAYSTSLGIGGTSDFSSLVAIRADDYDNNYVFFGNNGGIGNNFLFSLNPTGAFGVGRGGNSSGPSCGATTTTTVPAGVPGVGSYTRLTGTQAKVELNGGGDSTGPCATNFAGTGRLLGRRIQSAVSGGIFDGSMGEFVHYNRTLTDAELSRIQSYLAIKYGVTLDQAAPQDYVASDGATVAWSAATNGAYKHNIAGIGRDDNSALNQKQSKSQNLQGIVTIGHGTIETTNQNNTNNFANNLTFLMFGDDNSAVDSWIDTNIPALDSQDLKQVPREWKVQKTGTVGPLAISFNVNDPDANIAAPIENYYLINLTSGTAMPMSSSDSNNYSVSGVNFNNGDVFTIGTFAAEYNVRYRKTVSPLLTSIPPGQVFTYTITAENLGNTPLSGLSLTDDLSDVVDDAAYNGDVNSGGVGTPAWNGTNQISWNGSLNVGQTAVITYSFTMNDPTTGDGVLTNGVVATGPGSNCTEDPAVDPDCTITTPLPVVAGQKTLVGPASPQAGDIVNYQFTITNQGGAAASNVVVADELTEVLDDAIYNNDHSATSGSLSFNPLTRRLSWNGSLAANGSAGDTVTVTFSVTVRAADNLDDAMLNNALISPDCPNPPIFDSGNPGYDANCVTSTPVAAWVAHKSVAPAGNIDPGQTATYTIQVENTGAVNLTGGSAPSFEDDLTGVLDDAAYNNDASATAGTPVFSNPTLSWSAGSLNTGQTATIAYSITVNQPDALFDSLLANAVGAGPMNCPLTPTSNPGDPGFNTDCAALSSVNNIAEPPAATPEPNPDGGSGGLAGTGQSIAIFALIACLLAVCSTGAMYGQKLIKRS